MALFKSCRSGALVTTGYAYDQDTDPWGGGWNEEDTYAEFYQGDYEPVEDESVDVERYRWSDEEIERFILGELNPSQREAVTNIDGPTLVVAGPGSGKTKVITHRVAYLMREACVHPYRIAVLTFTNKAANELKQRLGQLLGGDAERLTAATFHSFCLQILRADGDKVGLPPGFVVYDDADQVATVGRAMTELGIDSRRFGTRYFLSEISGAKSKLLTSDDLARMANSDWDRKIAGVYRRYDEMLGVSCAVDFDDLLLKACNLFDWHPDVLEKYGSRFAHFMVDEFQDTNIAQYRIANQIASVHRNICVVGDPDQSIYTWRNADIRNILSFERDFPDAVRVALEENYRSTESILNAASSLISHNKMRLEKALWSGNGGGDLAQVIDCGDETHEAWEVADEIEALKAAGFSHKDIAVMYRTNAQSRPFEEAFVLAGLPYHIIGGLKFYHRQEIKDLLAYLRLIVNPNDDVSFARIVNQPPRGIGVKTLERLSVFASNMGVSRYGALRVLADEGALSGEVGPGILPAVKAALTRFYRMMEELRSECDEISMGQTLERVVQAIGYGAYLERQGAQGETRQENVAELFNIVSEVDGVGFEPIQGFLESASLLGEVEGGDDGGGDVVTLITLHQAKGLEFPVVFIVGMEEGFLPHKRSIDEPDKLEEERRLCYVGFTRAMRRLYLTSVSERRLYSGKYEPRQRSRFIGEVPEESLSWRS